jgi:hypothetical protein
MGSEATMIPIFSTPVLERRLLPKGYRFDHVEVFQTPTHIIVNGRFGYATWRFLRVVLPGIGGDDAD